MHVVVLVTRLTPRSRLLITAHVRPSRNNSVGRQRNGSARLSFPSRYFVMGVRLMFDSDREAQEQGATEESPTYTAWWFPFLNKSNEPGAKVNQMLADVAPGGKHAKHYKPTEPPTDFRSPVAPLPKKPTGVGLRKGATTLMSVYIAVEFVAYITGHTTGLMSLAYYIATFLCMCMPGARVLAGRPVPGYMRACGAPPAPSLAALHPLADDFLAKINGVLNYCFDINSASHPKLQEGGSLRPVLEMNLAALFKAYHSLVDDSSPDKGLLNDMVVKLRNALVASRLVLNATEAHVMLLVFSQQIKDGLDIRKVGDVFTESTGAMEPMATQACCTSFPC